MNASNWKVEVIADNGGKWCSNGMLFACELEARVHAIDMKSRWTSVRDYRVVEVPVERPLLDPREDEVCF